ncbi:hypothetical protein RO21_07985 [[Actinobacillus] muris]|uniref:EpsG family protein n=1 Tax=Muribacter muris TaxID=67855 RepID=A0A0J5P5T6_9PAST|nr:EpsG family protein [Muribacter muris]KMK51135.1 hypothetical protein RO21_07985 [[Actinobacillus] muris] [Muribacter muris]
MNSLLIYNSVILSPFLLLLSKQKGGKNIDNILLCTVTIYVIAISAIRYHVGTDFPSYEEIFLDPESHDRIEIGFIGLIKILKLFSDDPQILFLVTSMIIYYPIVKLYKTYESVAFIICWFLIFYFPSLNQIRQVIAITILTYSIKHINNFKSYILLILVASSFHITGFIGILFILLRKIYIRYIFILMLISPLFIYVHITNILANLPIIRDSYYIFYLIDENIYAGSQTLSFGGIFRLVIPFLFVYIYRINKSPHIILIKNALLIYTILYFLSINFYILYRVYSIFQIFIPIACIYLIKDKKYKLLVYLYIIILIIIFQKNIFEQSISSVIGNSIYPYQTIFTENPETINKINY